MNWNIFWACYMLPFGIATLIVYLIYGRRNRLQIKRCTSVTTGTIVGFTFATHNGVHLPIVSYTVNGRKYTVKGPKYRMQVTVKTSGFSKNKKPDEGMYESGKITNTPLDGNFYTNVPPEGEIPDVLVTRAQGSLIGGIYDNSISNRFDIGGQLKVYYDPKKPKRAFVERHPGYFKWLSALTLIISVACFTAAIYIAFFAPTIVMHSY